MTARFADVPEDVLRSPCPQCIHKHRGTATCEAFPAEIPAVILRGDHQHRAPFPGDHGIQFQPFVKEQ